MDLIKQMLKGRMSLVMLTVSAGILTMCVSLWWNCQLAFIIDTIDRRVTFPIQIIVTAALTILICSGTAYFSGMISGWTCETLTHDLRMGYAKHINMLSFTEIENMNSGECISRLQNEITDVSGYLRSNLFPIVNDFIRFAITFSWMLWLNAKLAILTYLPIIFILWYTVYASRVISDAVRRSQEANMKMNGFIETMVSIFPIIRIFDASQLMRNKYGKALKQWEGLSIKEERTCARLMSLSALLSYIPLIMLFLLGGSQVINSHMSLGTLYMFFSLSGNVTGVLMGLPGHFAAFRRFAVNMDRLSPSVLLLPPNSSPKSNNPGS